MSAEANLDSQKSNELEIDIEKRQINKLKEEFPVLEEQIQLKGKNVHEIVLFGALIIREVRFKPYKF